MEKLILLKDVQAEKTTTTVGIFKRASPVNVLKGELLVAIPGEDIVFRSDGKPAHNFRLAKDPSITLHAATGDVAPLNDYDFQLLEAIETSHARFESFARGKLEWAQSLKPGSNVYIGILPSRIRVSATVHFIGDVHTNQGLLFGVEIMDKNHRGQGTTDGAFQGKRYFKCEDNCGLFLPLDRVWQDVHGGQLGNWEGNIGGPAQNSCSPIQATPSGRSTGSSVDYPRFRIGDRVMVYNKGGVGIHGTVGWTRKHPSFPDSHIIGVETDVPVNKKDFEDSLLGLSQNMKVKDSRHGKVFLPEPFVASEEEAAGKRVQPSRVLPPHDQHPPHSQPLPRDHLHGQHLPRSQPLPHDHLHGQPLPRSQVDDSDPVALAVQYGVSKDELMAEQEEALRKAGENKEAKQIEALRKAVATKQIDVAEQQRVLQEIERKNKERKQAALQQRAGAQQNPPAPGYPVRSDPRNPTQPPAHPPHHPSQYPGQFDPNHPGQFGGSHIAQRPYERQPSQSHYEEIPDQQYQPRNVDASSRIYNRLNSRGYEGGSDQQPPSQPGHVPGQFQQQPISQQPPQVPPRTHLSHPLNQPPAQAWSTPPSDPLGATKPVAYATPRQGSARPYPDLGIGSTVQVSDPPRYGVVRWIGPLPEVQGLITGVELEDHMEGCTDGTWRGARYFTCAPGRGFFCPYFKLAPDQRFGETTHNDRALAKSCEPVTREHARKLPTLHTANETKEITTQEDDNTIRKPKSSSTSIQIIAQQLAREADEYQRKQEEKEQHIQELKRQLSQCKQTSEEKEIAIMEKEQEISEINEKLQYKTEDVTMLRLRCSEMEQELADEHQTHWKALIEKESEASELQRTLTDIQEELVHIQQELAQEKEDSDQFQKQTQEKTEELDRLRQELGEKREESDQLRQELGEKREESDQLRQELVKKREESDQLRQELGEKREESDQLRQELGEKMEESDQFQQQLQERVTQLAQSQQEASRMREELNQLRQQLTQKEDENQQLQARIDTAVAYLRGAPLTSEVGFDALKLWEVQKEEVHVSTRILGTGAWGYVAAGRFRGQNVAVKCLHRGILSQYTTAYVRKEMSIMAQVRHPNLVLLIGVVLDARAGPMIITELLSKSLRSAYEDHQLHEDSKLPILHNTASALNYLHLHRRPIIHRDVSSANILLEAIPNNAWKAKLSDFGSANLVRLATTPAEGCPVYAAPETRGDRTPQTPKVDVYSYGVLVCEVVTCQFPDPDNFDDMLQEARAQSPDALYRLIVSCRMQNPEERPTMSNILTELDQLLQ